MAKLDIKVQLNLDNLEGYIQAVNIMTSPKGMQLTAEKVKQLNIDQINKQIDADGKRVKRYSKLYEERKRERKVTYVSKKLKGKKGQTLKGQRSRGHMMAAFAVMRAKREYAEVGFRTMSAKLKATWNYERRGRELRKFIGLTAKNKRKVFKFFYRKLQLFR
jgi:hypothetical protein